VETKVTSRYIKIHIVSSSPGNEVHEYYQRVDMVVGFGEVAPQYAGIGACACVDLPGDARCYVKESVEDIYSMLNQIDLLP
jgi:hypothetical protein